MLSRVYTCQGLALGLCLLFLKLRLIFGKVRLLFGEARDSRILGALYRGTGNGTDRHRARVGLSARAKVRLRLGVASGLRLGGSHFFLFCFHFIHEVIVHLDQFCGSNVGLSFLSQSSLILWQDQSG